MKKLTLFLILLTLLTTGFVTIFTKPESIEDRILSYTVDPKKQDIQLYWKNDKGAYLSSIQNLKTFIESKGHKLVFAMNAGMYKKDCRHQGQKPLGCGRKYRPRRQNQSGDKAESVNYSVRQMPG